MDNLEELLRFVVAEKASDLHLSSGLPPMIRLNGDIKRINLPPLTSEQIQNMANGFMKDNYKKVFEETNDVDFSFSIPGLARFRANLFRQDREEMGVGCVFRTIPSKIFRQVGL